MKKQSEIIIYKIIGSKNPLEVAMQDETVWLTQKQMAILFGTEVPAISKHISNIFKSKELPKKTTVSKMEIV